MRLHAGEGKRRWLAYNAVGCVSSRAEEDHAVVEVAFHNTALHRKRVPLLTDFYRFSMASLSEQARAPARMHACTLHGCMHAACSHDSGRECSSASAPACTHACMHA
jgi:hypothetical protein